MNGEHMNGEYGHGVGTGSGRSTRSGRGNRSGRNHVNEMTWSFVHTTGRARVNGDTKWPRA